jgi:hypothetical protein
MNKQEAQKQYDEVQAELVKLKAIIDASDKAESWPQEGDKVYVLYADGCIDECTFDGCVFLLDHLAMGVLYRTQAEAFAARDKQKATVRVQDKLKELHGDWVADWSNLGQKKHYIFYDHITQCLAVNFDARHQRPTLYSTEEACLWVIENMEADVKLMLGVE